MDFDDNNCPFESFDRRNLSLTKAYLCGRQDNTAKMTRQPRTTSSLMSQWQKRTSVPAERTPATSPGATPRRTNDKTPGAMVRSKPMEETQERRRDRNIKSKSVAEQNNRSQQYRLQNPKGRVIGHCHLVIREDVPLEAEPPQHEEISPVLHPRNADIQQASVAAATSTTIKAETP